MGGDKGGDKSGGKSKGGSEGKGGAEKGGAEKGAEKKKEEPKKEKEKSVPAKIPQARCARCALRITLRCAVPPAWDAPPSAHPHTAASSQRCAVHTLLSHSLTPSHLPAGRRERDCC